MEVLLNYDNDFDELHGKIHEILEESKSLATGIRGWQLLSIEGLPISSHVRKDMDESQIAAITASILSVADLAAERFEHGLLEEVFITNEKGQIMVKGAGDRAILVLEAAKEMKPGLLVYAAKTAAEKIAKIL
ncbi:MAG: roadblock/LC7 domain-containing protein [Candidatus Thorarchaeota archaeon]